MINIMIVDDMPIFLEYLEHCIAWEEYGFTVCARAADGREALEKMETIRPDVVLTDIVMPYMDGIQLAERIMKDYPETSIVLISGNNEFEYARKAVKIGVCDYIVKPFEKEELLMSLLKLQDNMKKALEQKNYVEETRELRKETILQGILLRKNIGGFVPEAETLEREGIGFDTDFFLVCSLKLKVENAEEIDQIINWQKIICRMLRNMLEIDGRFEVFRDIEDHIVILLNFDTEQGMKNYKAYELNDLIKIIKKQLDLECVVCVSDVCYGIAQIGDAYMDTIQLLQIKQNEKMFRVWDFRQSQKLQKSDKQFLDAVRKEKDDSIVAEVRSFIHNNYQDPELCIADISKKVLLNQTYLRKVFKNEMEMTLSEYITRHRMHIAKQLILTTEKNLSQISEEVGYRDLSYFSKCFKKYYGVSPKNMNKYIYQCESVQEESL